MTSAQPFASTATRDLDRNRERIQFTHADFQIIADLAMRDFGLHLTLAKRDLVYSRLLKRLRILGFEHFSDYCDLVSSPEGEEERAAMLSALTTNVTHFFREDHHFKLLSEVALPPLIKAARDGGRVRMWSAGCSAGQEAYSLAFTLLNLCPEAAKLNIRILATDVDAEILAKAEAAVYPGDERKSIPEALRKFLEPLSDDRFTISQSVRNLITFGRLNLIESWPLTGPFQVIFCRNVAIYFDKPTQSRLWARFGDLLAPGGHLCIGHSERVTGPAEHMLHAVGITAYQRTVAGVEPIATPSKRQEGHPK